MTNQLQADSSAVDNDPVTQYALDVTKGLIIAGPYVRASCARHLKDLKEAHQRGFFFDTEKVGWVIDFFKEVLCLNGGEFEGIPYELLPWQKFIVGSLFGWCRTDGTRRFRLAFVETSKGSGKSPLAAGIGMYGLVADNEPRAEIYAAAAKKDQAMVLFRDAVAMADLSPELSSRLVKSGVGDKAWNLAYLEAGSFFRPISSDDNQSGPRPHIALLDEIHEHKDANVVEMMKAGRKGRRQPLIFMITNSGYDINSPCGQQHDYAVNVATGQLDDDEFFSYVCSLDKLPDSEEYEDPFQDESCWVKTNPSLGVTIQLDYLRAQVREARGMPSKESIVRRLNFSQWVQAANPWIDSQIWFACQAQHTAAELAGRRCWGGLDLSSTTDLTALVLAFEPTYDDQFWRLLPYFWLPESGLIERERKDKVSYTAWVRQGWLETTPGKAINKLFIIQRLAEITADFDLQHIGYDRWRIEDLKSMLSNEGISIPLKEFGQGFKDMSPAVETLEALLTNEEIRHNGSPVLTWCAANTVMESDPTNNRKPSKKKAVQRIDGIVASIMAIGTSGADVNKMPVFDDDYELMVA